MAGSVSHNKPLVVFLNERVDTSSWETILAGLEENPRWSYIAYERDDDGEVTALSYRWDDKAVNFASTENWDAALQEFQANRCFTLREHDHTHRLREHVDLHKKMWVDQHCIPQVNGRMGCVKRAGVLYQGPVTAAFLTKHMVDAAFSQDRAHELLGYLENWLGRGWVQQEVTARGKLMNLDAFEHFLKRGQASGDGRLKSGAESLCMLLRRMKGCDVEPLADRFVRFYAVFEADFTVEDDREINEPDFSDIGYESFPVNQAPAGYKLQPEVQVADNRVYMKDANGHNIGKWFQRKALYVKT